MSKSWKKRIEEAKVRGSFTASDQRRVGNWKTCFVGELKGIDKRSDPTYPYDETLLNLGWNAMTPVENNNPAGAEQIHTEIHERAKQVRKMQREANK